MSFSSKFLYALGYNVPENYIVRFRPDQLKVDAKTKFTDHYGKRRAMTNVICAKCWKGGAGSRTAKFGRWQAGSFPGRRWVPSGTYGTRTDDPNDTVPHEHRRDLRGLRVFAAWLGHDDSKSLNTLDTLVEENGVQYVKHYLIDFGASLGSASYGPNSPRSGNDYLFQWGPAARQFLTLGLSVPKWARAKYPDIPDVGAFEYEMFDPERWVPEYPNPAFSNMNADDAFWAARQVMAFTDEDIRTIVETGEYSDKRAEDWVVRCLIERRNKIGRAYFSRVLPLDRFAIRTGRLEFEDLAATYFGMEDSYSVEWFTFDNKTAEVESISGATTFAVPDSQSAYLVANIRGARRGHRLVVGVRNGHEVVGRGVTINSQTDAVVSGGRF